ncbi:sugar ABC transporter substrate-binding protein [Roseibium sediminicola]|uniref:Sugar ABC transporter substrate-binding protein n=1 Tax=Roseibium sediminicola TaxID=2933272 RepID=A0ABT0H201_9HYPH|nr:sugar ABC transporter substrate-binding protein [Roseibium sp. CAU 1639]MCK7615722.1 sugar ABC transporter substrate-binding protein [Roseibium sp. CAU 1639]
MSRKNSVFFRLAGLCLTGILSLSAGAIPQTMAEEREIAVLLPAAGAPYFRMKAYGYVDEAKQHGFKVSIFDAGGFGNLQKQITQVEDAVTRGVSAIILVPASSEGTSRVVDRAVEAGIPIINDGIATESSNLTSFVGEPSYTMTELLAAHLVEKLGGKGKVAILTGPGGLDLTRLRNEGLMNYLARFEGIDVVAEKATPVSSSDAFTTTQDFLQANPDIKGIYAFTGAMAIGVVQALRVSGKTPGEVTVVTADLEPETDRLIREGWISATVISQPVEMARIAVRTAVQAADGETVNAEILTQPSIVTNATIDAVDLSGQFVPEDWN